MARAIVALVLTLLAACTDGSAPPQLSPGGDVDLGMPADLAGKCSTACDCPDGQACRMGQCQMLAAPVFCCTSATCTGSAICELPNGMINQCDRRDGGAVTPIVDGGVTTSTCEMIGCSKGPGSETFCRLACGGPATCVGTGGKQHCMP